MVTCGARGEEGGGTVAAVSPSTCVHATYTAMPARIDAHRCTHVGPILIAVRVRMRSTILAGTSHSLGLESEIVHVVVHCVPTVLSVGYPGHRRSVGEGQGRSARTHASRAPPTMRLLLSTPAVFHSSFSDAEDAFIPSQPVVLPTGEASFTTAMSNSQLP